MNWNLEWICMVMAAMAVMAVKYGRGYMAGILTS